MARALGSLLALGAVLGWLTGASEALVLAVFSSRGPQTLSAWIHALWIAGLFGMLLATSIGLLLATARKISGAPRQPEGILLGCIIAGLGLIIGGYWFSRWGVIPSLSTLRGGLLAGAFLIAVFVAAGGVARVMRRFELVEPLSESFPAPFLGALALLASLVPFWVLPNHPSGFRYRAEIAGPTAGPPVILIMIDTLRRDHLGCYGYALPTSPSIDQLARQSVLFLSSSTTGNYTLPSTATLFTGLYPSAHGVIGPGRSLPDGVLTLPEIFKSAGYRTAALVANPLVRAELGFGRGFDHYTPGPPPRWIHKRKTALELLYLRFVQGRIPWAAAEDLVPEAIEWLAESSPQPPFLYLHLIEPHSEYAPPREHALPFLQQAPESWVGRPPLIDHFRPADEWQTWAEVEEKPKVTEAEKLSMIGLYNGEIHYVDYWIGVILDSLEKMDLSEDSIIVLLADHGEEFDDHGGWVHGNTLYEEMIGMPLLIKLPGGLHEGLRSRLSVDMVDLRATLAGLAAVEAPPDSGSDYSEQLLSPILERAETVQYYTERPPHLYSLRAGDWKIVRRDRRGSSSSMLFNLVTDPGEMNDLASEQLDRLQALEAALESSIQTARGSSAAQSIPETPEVDPETERVLKALGYIQ